MSKMIKLSCLLVIIVVLVTKCSGQWPLGPEFYNGMNRMVNNLNNMAVRMQAMGERLAREREAELADARRRAQEGIPFGGGMVFVTADGGLGYTYNSTDGSSTLYSLGNGSPPHGYMYHIGSFGGTSYSSW